MPLFLTEAKRSKKQMPKNFLKAEDDGVNHSPLKSISPPSTSSTSVHRPDNNFRDSAAASQVAQLPEPLGLVPSRSRYRWYHANIVNKPLTATSPCFTVILLDSRKTRVKIRRCWDIGSWLWYEHWRRVIEGWVIREPEVGAVKKNCVVILER